MRLPPRWFMHAFWVAHRALLRATGGRAGLWRARPGHAGALQLVTTGRRTGQQRGVVVEYLEDGADLVTLAMNGGAPTDPAWWLNLQAHPDATVRTLDGVLRVRAHRAQGPERERLWARWTEVDRALEGYSARRPRETAVVVLRPQPNPGVEPGSAVR